MKKASALAKAASAVMLVKAAATAGAKGAKLGSKSSKELLESLPKITEQFRRSDFVTPEGIKVKVPAWEADGTISYSKNPNPVQQYFIENYLKEREGTGGIEGTGKPIPVTKVNYGDHFSKRGRKKVLKPNVEYTSPDGYTYRTDSHGRIVECEGDLILGSADRNEYAQRTVGGKDRLPDDDGGHLIGAQFKGPKDIDNLVPQNSQINRSGAEWFDMETVWANALKETPPKKVIVKIDPIYSGNSMRPDSFEVVYQIEGKRPVKKTIKNQVGG